MFLESLVQLKVYTKRSSLVLNGMNIDYDAYMYRDHNSNFPGYVRPPRGQLKSIYLYKR